MPRKPTGRPPGRPRHPETLTPAEQRVLAHLREGLPNAEIAVRLGISPDAVKYHVSNMLGKLEMENREQLAAWREPSGLRRIWLGVPVALKWAGGATAVAVVGGVGAIMAFGAGESSEPDEPLDLYTGIITLNANGEPGNGRSWWPSMSADGRYVAFESTASDLVPGDTNGVSDIFVFDRHTREMRRISIGLNGEEADGPSYRPSISADGRLVAFDSEATNLVEGDKNHELANVLRWAHPDIIEILDDSRPTGEATRRRVAGSDVFVADLHTGEIELVSVTSGGEPANLGSSYPVISGDGRFVVFESIAPNLAGLEVLRLEPPTGFASLGGGRVYLRDRDAGTTVGVSARWRTDETQWAGGGLPWISRDGRYVTFISRAADLAGLATHTNGMHLYLWAREDDVLTWVPVPEPPDPDAFYLVQFISRATVSSDGGRVAYVLQATDSEQPGVFISDVGTGEVTRISPDGFPVGQATTMLFDAGDRGLIFDAIGSGEILSYDMATNDFSVVAGPEPPAMNAALSGDGAWLAGTSFTPLGGSSEEWRTQIFVVAR